MAITYSEVQTLQGVMTSFVNRLGTMQVMDARLFPYGWQNAAKGRTVWRLLEELIVQNLLHDPQQFGLTSVTLPTSEVGVWDLMLRHPDIVGPVYINVKSSTNGIAASKDDISKAIGLHNFYSANPDASLYVITFCLQFLTDMQINICNVAVMPVSWIPDIYVNPSNNGNLQSSMYKNIDSRIERTNQEFMQELERAMAIASKKRMGII